MQVLLFDLGGVVVGYDGPGRLAALSKGAMSFEDARAALGGSANLHAYERGEIEEEAFAARAIDEWRLDMSPQDFIADFETWPDRLLPGSKAAIDRLRGRYRLACLSNINTAHWRQAEALGLGGWFEHAFLSHEMGARKPEPAIYEKAIASLGATAGQIIFFDDMPANINAARAAGMTAHHVPAPGDLPSLLYAVL